MTTTARSLTDIRPQSGVVNVLALPCLPIRLCTRRSRTSASVQRRGCGPNRWPRRCSSSSSSTSSRRSRPTARFQRRGGPRRRETVWRPSVRLPRRRCAILCGRRVRRKPNSSTYPSGRPARRHRRGRRQVRCKVSVPAQRRASIRQQPRRVRCCDCAGPTRCSRATMMSRSFCSTRAGWSPRGSGASAA